MTGTIGSDGSELPDRLKRYGTVELGMGQSNCFGSDSAIQIVIDLLVCDGDADRCNRLNIFNTIFNEVGIYSAPVGDSKNISVIVYCGLFTKEGEVSKLQEKINEFMAEPIPAPPVERHLYKDY